MTHLRTIFASLIVAAPLTATSSAALAGGMAEPIETPAPAVVPVMPSTDWTGFYVGGQLGYADVDSDALDDDTNGAIFGVHAGYLYDFGSIVLGGEVDYDGTTIESDIPGDGVEIDAISRAKLRAGYDAGDWLPYLTAGAVQAQTSGAVDGDGTGAFAGLGIEYKRSDALRIGWEVLQHQFEDFNDTDGLDLDVTTASLRVSYQF